MQMEKNDRIEKLNHHIYETKIQIDKLKYESESKFINLHPFRIDSRK